MAADNEDEAEEEETGPAVELGDGESVEGVPVARVASRLTWPIEKSAVVRKEGESVVRTPEGGREVATLLDESDRTYFTTRQEFVDAIRDVAGTGPVPTE